MGIFKKNVQPPSTAPGPVDDVRPAGNDTDIEKMHEMVNLEHEPAAAPQARPQIDRAMEKRILKKLDWNLVSLVTFLCELRHDFGQFKRKHLY